MPGLDPGIHVLIVSKKEDVDGRDEPGHDCKVCARASYGLFGSNFFSSPFQQSA